MNRESLIVCPVHNEYEHVEEFLGQLRDHYSRDILFVDDGSTDGSREFLAAVRDGRTLVLRQPRRRGYGAALISGFAFSLSGGYGKVVTMDVDLQHDPEHVERFLRELDTCEAVLGSRYIRIDNYLDIPRTRLLINRYVARLLKLLFDADFTDPFCGYRGYRSSFLKKARLEEESYGMGLEILLELVRTNTPFKEIPVEAIYPNPYRTFLDGLDNPRRRLHHYLGVIARKRREIKDEKKAAQAARG